MKKTPKWILKKVLLLLQGEILADHGGLEGLGDEGLLESALARPKNLFAHSSDVHIAQLAASYCFGIIQNHPFLDGNKRTGFLSIGLFLEPQHGLDQRGLPGPGVPRQRHIADFISFEFLQCSSLPQ